MLIDPTKTTASNDGECPDCGHPKIRHVQDGLGMTCLVCDFLQREKQLSGKVCTRVFQFKLSQVEREQAARAAKDTFPPHTVCAICTYEWQQHMGMLCPNGDDTFLPLLDTDYLV